jgi:hypothetical protein
MASVNAVAPLGAGDMGIAYSGCFAGVIIAAGATIADGDAADAMGRNAP